MRPRRGDAASARPDLPTIFSDRVAGVPGLEPRTTERLGPTDRPASIRRKSAGFRDSHDSHSTAKYRPAPAHPGVSGHQSGHLASPRSVRPQAARLWRATQVTPLGGKFSVCRRHLRASRDNNGLHGSQRIQELRFFLGHDRRKAEIVVKRYSPGSATPDDRLPQSAQVLSENRPAIPPEYETTPLAPHAPGPRGGMNKITLTGWN
jgi:hypothetical protein